MGSLPNLSILKGPVRQYKSQCLQEIFENLATSTAANNTAVIYEGSSYTYKDLNAITNQIARQILEFHKENYFKSNSDGDFVVAVSMQPSDRLIIALLSIWKAGAAYLPLDVAFPQPRVEHILSESKPIMVIHDEDPGYFKNTFSVNFNSLFEKSLRLPVNAPEQSAKFKHAKDDVAIVIYTSGSTGIPKGVRILHKAILNRLYWQFKEFPYSATEKVAVFKTALTFVDSVAEIWGPLISGIAILVVPKLVTKNPEAFIDLLERYKVERLVLVPSLLRSLLMVLKVQKNERTLKRLKTWVCSGETLAVSLAEEFFDYFSDGEHKLCNFYGSTEVMGDVTYYTVTGVNKLSQEKVPIGIPVDNTIIYLLDNDFRPVKTGELGELYVSGLNLAAGYCNNRDPERFIENPLAIDPAFSKLYKTGDFARLEKDVLLYEGRTDSQVKIRGHRVDLSEIEKAVESLKSVEKAIVLCYKPGEIDQALLAFVVSKISNIKDKHIEDELKTALPEYMVPQVIIVDNLPLLINGKIDRQSLLKQYENKGNGTDSSEAKISYRDVPLNQQQAARVLFETVASVLGQSARACISIDANFYELGGNSLNSIYTITKLNDKGYNISIGDFISAANFGEILKKMVGSDTKLINGISLPKFTSEPLKPEHKDIVQEMIVSSFYHKAELESFIMDMIFEEDYAELVDKFYQPLLDQNLSYVAKTESGKIVAVAINLDAADEPPIETHSMLSIIWDFLDYVEIPAKSKLPSGKGKIFHAVMMATHSSLTHKDNVAVMQYLEDEVLKLAAARGFEGIFTTNTSPLTQQLATDVYGYETLLDYQINQYVAPDGSKPFGAADDSVRALVQWKPIR